MFQFGNETEESVSPVQQISEDVKPCCITSSFFFTPAAEKTETQVQNSSRKLKEKTQPQGGIFFVLRKTQETNSI